MQKALPTEYPEHTENEVSDLSEGKISSLKSGCLPSLFSVGREEIRFNRLAKTVFLPWIPRVNSVKNILESCKQILPSWL